MKTDHTDHDDREAWKDEAIRWPLAQVEAQYGNYEGMGRQSRHG
ncbi:hypothetical protein [Acetobacter oeni]|uniref:Uncharacterized protein n=1 Tax=Acetobacter oeni TaxID=304077 RepID=A0A511XQI5_9PROT|nr:hypothetical protein [Acetobacter oeni]MBB3884813.1 hypothetical protein [Acetobacter oeni]GEN65228.1 hypothetical protein AOE01nite_34520 [Acetobacter oeni]